MKSYDGHNQTITLLVLGHINMPRKFHIEKKGSQKSILVSSLPSVVREDLLDIVVLTSRSYLLGQNNILTV